MTTTTKTTPARTRAESFGTNRDRDRNRETEKDRGPDQKTDKSGLDLGRGTEGGPDPRSGETDRGIDPAIGRETTTTKGTALLAIGPETESIIGIALATAIGRRDLARAREETDDATDGGRRVIALRARGQSLRPSKSEAAK